MTNFLKQWAKKFFERESYYVVFLIAIATTALFREKCDFLEWAGACAAFAGIGLGALQFKRRIQNGSYQNGATLTITKDK